LIGGVNRKMASVRKLRKGRKIGRDTMVQWGKAKSFGYERGVEKKERSNTRRPVKCHESEYRR